ncbi:MAG: HDOD domain-containing protein [Opitutales bacterium]
MRVLVVDSDPTFLRSLQRSQPELMGSWDCRLAASEEAAVELMTTFAADVVIAEFYLGGGRTGLEVLESIAALKPDTIRILTGDRADRRMAIQAVSAAHQFIGRNDPTGAFVEAVDRALRLREMISNPGLRSLINSIQALPSLPSLYLDITRELRSVDPDIDKLIGDIEMDPAITAKVLQLVNSGFFALPERIADVGEASRLLGIEMLQSLVLLSGVFSQFEQQGGIFLSVHSFWKHSLAVGRLAQAVVRFLPGGEDFRQEAFTAGLLHDIGDLILSVHRHREHTQASQVSASENLPRHRVERQLIGASHADAGAYMLNLWGLPITTVEAVAYHHDPEKTSSSAPSVLTAVHLANALEHHRKAGSRPQRGNSFHRGYLARLGLEDKIDEMLNLHRKIRLP